MIRRSTRLGLLLAYAPAQWPPVAQPKMLISGSPLHEAIASTAAPISATALCILDIESMRTIAKFDIVAIWNFGIFVISSQSPRSFTWGAQLVG